jgi:hypothetical protein
MKLQAIARQRAAPAVLLAGMLTYPAFARPDLDDDPVGRANGLTPALEGSAQRVAKRQTELAEQQQSAGQLRDEILDLDRQGLPRGGREARFNQLRSQVAAGRAQQESTIRDLRTTLDSARQLINSRRLVPFPQALEKLTKAKVKAEKAIADYERWARSAGGLGALPSRPTPPAAPPQPPTPVPPAVPPGGPQVELIKPLVLLPSTTHEGQRYGIWVTINNHAKKDIPTKVEIALPTGDRFAPDNPSMQFTARPGEHRYHWIAVAGPGSGDVKVRVLYGNFAR